MAKREQRARKQDREERDGDWGPPPPDHLPTMKAQATLPDHLTEEILLRVPTAADLARASMAGPSLRRVIADHSFLRRFHTLHPPPLLGILSTSFLPAEPPHPSTAAAQTLADTDFSYSFVPSGEHPWRRCDFRDGRALLCVGPQDLSLVRDIAVCDPLHQRYILLPPVPRDLSDPVYHYEPFLAPATGDEGTDIAADSPFRFRVMCLAECQTQLFIFVFSSSGPRAGQWHAVTFDGWSALFPGNSHASTAFGNLACGCAAFGNRYYAHGCFCWSISGINKILMFDIGTMEFSSVNLPPSPWDIYGMAFVEAREGRIGMFALSKNRIGHAYHLWYTVLCSIGHDPRQRQTEDVVPLPHDYCYDIIGVAGGYLLLQGYPDDSDDSGSSPSSLDMPEGPELDCFSLNLQTMKLERFSGPGDLQGQLYAGFPPSLSPPTI